MVKPIANEIFKVFYNDKLKIIINEKNRLNYTVVKAMLVIHYNINEFLIFFNIRNITKVVNFIKIKKNNVKIAAVLYLIRQLYYINIKFKNITILFLYKT